MPDPVNAEAKTHHVATDAKLKPLAEILSEEILLIAKINLAPARYVRVTMLKNSVQQPVELDEVRVYEAGK